MPPAGSRPHQRELTSARAKSSQLQSQRTAAPFGPQPVAKEHPAAFSEPEHLAQEQPAAPLEPAAVAKEHPAAFLEPHHLAREQPAALSRARQLRQEQPAALARPQELPRKHPAASPRPHRLPQKPPAAPARPTHLRRPHPAANCPSLALRKQASVRCCRHDQIPKSIAPRAAPPSAPHPPLSTVSCRAPMEERLLPAATAAQKSSRTTSRAPPERSSKAPRTTPAPGGDVPATSVAARPRGTADEPPFDKHRAARVRGSARPGGQAELVREEVKEEPRKKREA